MLPADVAFMDKAAWKKYAGASNDSNNGKDSGSADNNDGSDKRIITGRVTIELD